MIFLRKHLGVDQVQQKICQEAVSILEKFATDGRVPLPRFDYQQSAHRFKKPKPEHIVFCRFSIPEFLRRLSPVSLATVEMIIGAGRDEGYEGAKALAALEVLHRLDEHITGKKFQKQANRIYRPFQGRVLLEYQKYKTRQTLLLQKHHQILEQYDPTIGMPAHPQQQHRLHVPGASWHHLPYDPAFERPNSRSGRIEFSSSVRSHHEACIAAKVITLISRHNTNPKSGVSSYLPSVTFQTEDQVNRLGKRKRVITANIVTNQDPYSKYSITGTKAYDTSVGVKETRQYKADGPEEMMERSKARAIERALVQIYDQLTRYQQNAMVQFLESHPNQSLGMAKLFVEWPSQHIDEIQALLQSIQQSKTQNSNHNNEDSSSVNNNPQQQKLLPRRNRGSSSSANIPKLLSSYMESEHDQQITARRIETLRKRQREQPLPIDSVEAQLKSLLFENQHLENPTPENEIHDDPEEDDRPVVTLVYGGTGSGKSTRVPLLLSLFDPNPHARVVVAQPRRLACQASAERVAYEQGYTIGNHKNKKHLDPNDDTTTTTVPIGYAVRFDSQLSRGKRTVDFCTPGILLRWAIEDELLLDITHLVIDEVHERNADMDMLLAMGKQAVWQRKMNGLPPLNLVLMSATTDSVFWSKYFQKYNMKVVTIHVPEARRFPIDIIHLDDSRFPGGNPNVRSIDFLRTNPRFGRNAFSRDHTYMYQQDRWRNNNGEYVGDALPGLTEEYATGAAFDNAYLLELKRKQQDDFDDILCRATAETILQIAEKDPGLNGSILCFLPGMEEIRLTDKYIDQFGGAHLRKKFDVLYLHSSVSSIEQNRVFISGPKVILSTNIAETSLTIPDVKYCIDSGRERQYSMMSQSSSSSDSATTVVGSQLVTVNISLASANQRAGRTGRVSAGTVYRLYNEDEANYNFLKHTVPEMLRMELSQLVLHTLSFSSSDTSDPLRLLLETPDPPTKERLKQTIRGLVYQGLVEGESDCETNLRLTPLGHAVSTMPASPRIGRMLFMGLALRAIGPALDIAALLSVPKVLMADFGHQKKHCSDIMQLLKEYGRFLKMGDNRGKHPESRSFELVGRVRQQLEDYMLNFIRRKIKGSSLNNDFNRDQCNENSERLASFVALIVAATPHVAHLVDGQSNFAVRDVSGTASMHPSSVNYENDRRVHWYVYNELRVTKKPFLFLTTAVSPLDIALFSDANDLNLKTDDESDAWSDDWGGYRSKESFADDWLFAVDQWVPVNVRHSDRELFLELRKLLNDTMLQEVAQDPVRVLASKEYKQIVLHVLAALERQRLGI